AERNRAGRRDRQRPDLRPGTRPRGVARAGAASGDHRRQTAARRHYQTRHKYLRKLLIHGARAALPRLANSGSPLGEWLRALMGRTHKNAAVVALANKLARIAWAVLRRGEDFKTAAA